MKDYVNVKPSRKPWISSGVKCRLCDSASMIVLVSIEAFLIVSIVRGLYD